VAFRKGVLYIFFYTYYIICKYNATCNNNNNDDDNNGDEGKNVPALTPSDERLDVSEVKLVE